MLFVDISFLERPKSTVTKGRSPGLVVMGLDSCSKCCEFKYRHCILDGHFFTFIWCKIVMFTWKDENKWKRCREWPIIFLIIIHILIWAKLIQHVLDYLSPDDTKKTRKNLSIFLPSFCHFLLLLSSGFVSTYFTHLWTVSCSYPQGFDNHKNKTFSYKNCKECYYKMV